MEWNRIDRSCQRGALDCIETDKLADACCTVAFGFNTETGPGPAIPQPDSLVKFLPPQNRWPIDKVWTHHAGGGGYTSLDTFNAGMRGTYGWPDHGRILADFTGLPDL